MSSQSSDSPVKAKSSVTVELRVGFVFTLKAGQIVEVVNYLDPTEALQAAGLKE